MAFAINFERNNAEWSGIGHRVHGLSSANDFPFNFVHFRGVFPYTLKDSVLDTGINLKERAGVVYAHAETTSDASDESSEGQSIMETVKSLRKTVLDQAAEVRVLKDVLEAIKVQNTVLTQRLKCPDNTDPLFTVQGAKDFTRCTGVITKLCAGIKPTD